MHTLPQLDYSYSDLEPYIDAKTMEIHHTKHHQSYINNLNTALDNYPDLQKLSVKDLLSNIDKVPAKIRQTVINNAGGHVNHSQFWQILNPKGMQSPNEKFTKLINQKFESLDQLILSLQSQGLGHFGSGWVWLTANKKGELSILTTANQDSPYLDKLTPLLGVDLWEHAYYLKYQNRRKDYLEEIFKIIDWQIVSKRYQGFINKVS